MNLVHKFSLNRFTMKSKKKKTNRIVSTIPFVLSRKNYLYLTFFYFPCYDDSRLHEPYFLFDLAL